MKIKSQIVYPQLGIVDEVEEEVIEKQADRLDITQRSGKSQKGRETLNRKNRHRSLKKTNGGKSK